MVMSNKANYIHLLVFVFFPLHLITTMFHLTLYPPSTSYTVLLPIASSIEAYFRNPLFSFFSQSFEIDFASARKLFLPKSSLSKISRPRAFLYIFTGCCPLSLSVSSNPRTKKNEIDRKFVLFSKI